MPPERNNGPTAFSTNVPHIYSSTSPEKSQAPYPYPYTPPGPAGGVAAGVSGRRGRRRGRRVRYTADGIQQTVCSRRYAAGGIQQAAGPQTAYGMQQTVYSRPPGRMHGAHPAPPARIRQRLPIGKGCHMHPAKAAICGPPGRRRAAAGPPMHGTQDALPAGTEPALL